MDKLKPKEKRVLDFINQTIDEQGYPPSVREICSSLGIKSTSTAHMYIERLASKGYIEKLAGKSRAIKKNDEGAEEGKRYRVPLVGQVAAGLPILATQNLEGYITYSTFRTYDESKLFCLKIKGESMIEAGIFDGDYVEQQLIALLRKDAGYMYKSSLRKYIGLWFKMKSSVYFRADRKRECWKYGMKSLRYNPACIGQYAILLLAVLPLGVRNMAKRYVQSVKTKNRVS